MPSSGSCCVCGCETDAYIGYDGVLCSRHYAQFKSDDEDRVRWYENEHDRIQSILQDIESELGDGAYGRQHNSSSGCYWIECNRCSGGFYSDDYSDSGLCVSCSSIVSALESKRSRIWSDFENRHQNRIDSINRRYGLKVS